MRQRESWRKVRRDNAIRAEKKVESFSSTIKSGLIDFQCRREGEKGREGGREGKRGVVSHYEATQKAMLRNAKERQRRKKEERTIALVRAVDACQR